MRSLTGGPARLMATALRGACARIARGLPYTDKNEKKIGELDPRIVFRAAAVTGTLTKKDKDGKK